MDLDVYTGQNGPLTRSKKQKLDDCKSKRIDFSNSALIKPVPKLNIINISGELIDESPFTRVKVLTITNSVISIGASITCETIEFETNKSNFKTGIINIYNIANNISFDRATIRNSLLSTLSNLKANDIELQQQRFTTKQIGNRNFFDFTAIGANPEFIKSWKRRNFLCKKFLVIRNQMEVGTYLEQVEPSKRITIEKVHKYMAEIAKNSYDIGEKDKIAEIRPEMEFIVNYLKNLRLNEQTSKTNQ